MDQLLKDINAVYNDILQDKANVALLKEHMKKLTGSGYNIGTAVTQLETQETLVDNDIKTIITDLQRSLIKFTALANKIQNIPPLETAKV